MPNIFHTLDYFLTKENRKYDLKLYSSIFNLQLKVIKTNFLEFLFSFIANINIST